MNLSRRIVAAAASVTLTLGLGVAPSTAQIPGSSLPPSAAEAFVATPTDVAQFGAPGTVLKRTAAPQLLNILGPNYPGHAEKILYTTTTQHGEKVKTTGMVLQPAGRWTGKGATPTVVITPGTRGQGDQCAASRSFWNIPEPGMDLLSAGNSYEGSIAQALSLSGIRVFIVDFIGLGSPGIHTYMNRDDQAHAALDGARAALAASGVAPDSPVAFTGYSQGGGGAAAAGEAASTYAPELNVKGTAAGAPPADLIGVLPQVDGSAIFGVFGYALNGLLERYPELKPAVDENFNARGQQFLTDNRTNCIADSVAKWSFQSSRTLTKTGESFMELINRDERFKKALSDQRIGFKNLNAPMVVYQNRTDDIIPYAQAKQMARDFCANSNQPVYFHEYNYRGIDVSKKAVIGHAAPLPEAYLAAANWLKGRFNDNPAPNNCSKM